MKVSQLRDVLLGWQNLLRETGISVAAEEIGAFAHLFLGHESKTVPVFAKGLKGLAVLQSGQVGILLTGIIHQLKRLTRIYECGNARTQATDLQTLVNALSPFADSTVENLIAAMQSADRSPGPPRKRPIPNPGLALVYVEELKTVSDDKSKWDAVIARMKSDSRFVGSILTEIVNSHTGHEGSFKNKKAAFDWLVSSYIRRERFKNKLRSADVKP
jgi:hypothetical protein